MRNLWKRLLCKILGHNLTVIQRQVYCKYDRCTHHLGYCSRCGKWCSKRFYL